MKYLDLITSNYKDQSKLLKFALDNSGDPIFWADWDAMIIYANKKATSLLGYSKEELVQMTVYDIDVQFPKEDWPRRFNKLKRNKVLTINSIYKCKEGRVIPVEITGNYLRFKNKDYICIAFRDLTERMKMEEELRKCGEKYHSIFDNARDGIVIIDVNDGHILDCNPQFEKQSGRDCKELQQLKIWEIVPAEKIDAARKKFCEICSNGHGTSTELDYQKPNGELVPIEFWAKKIQVCKKQFILSINRDLSQIKKLEDELSLEKNKYQFFFNEADDGLAILDLSGLPEPSRYTDVNKRMTEILGYTKQELLRMNPIDMILSQAEKREAMERLKKATLEREEHLKIFFHFLTKDGRNVPLEIDVHIMWSKGIALSIYRDVGERIQFQNRLMRQITKEKRLRKQLESQINKRIEFTRSLIHELKTPLTPLIGASEMLTESLKGSNLERVAKNIYKGALSLNNRVDDLVDLVKGEMGLLSLHLSLTNIPYLLKSCIEYTTPLATRKKQTINLAVDDTIPNMKIDEERILQVIHNILGNAIRYTQTNGSITVSAKNNKDIITIEISDTGCGIPKEGQKIIFEPFSSDKKNKLNPSGLGIGLPLSKMIVDLHHGSIGLDSSLGKGSIFTIKLPLSINNNGGRKIN